MSPMNKSAIALMRGFDTHEAITRGSRKNFEISLRAFRLNHDWNSLAYTI
jgi:hypothetical protein